MRQKTKESAYTKHIIKFAKLVKQSKHSKRDEEELRDLRKQIRAILKKTFGSNIDLAMEFLENRLLTKNSVTWSLSRTITFLITDILEHERKNKQEQEYIDLETRAKVPNYDLSSPELKYFIEQVALTRMETYLSFARSNGYSLAEITKALQTFSEESCATIGQVRRWIDSGDEIWSRALDGKNIKDTK